MVLGLYRWVNLSLLVVFSLLSTQLLGQSTYESIKEIIPNQPDSAFVLSKLWNESLIENQQDSLLGRSYYLLGLCSYFKSEYYLAENFFNRAIKYLDEDKDISLIEACYNNIGVCYEMAGYLDKALEAYHESEKIAIDLNDTFSFMQTRINIGLLQIKVDELDKGLSLLKQAEHYFSKQNDSINLALVYQNLAKWADEKYIGLDSFIFYSKKTYEIYKYYDYRPGMAEILNNLGYGHLYNGDYALALDYLNQAYELSKDAGQKIIEGYALSNLGEYYYQVNKMEVAKDLLNKAFIIFEELNNSEQKEIVLWKLLKVNRNNVQSFEVIAEKIKNEREHSIKSESKIRVDQLNTFYEVEKKEQIIAQQQLELKIEKNKNIGFLVGIISCLILAVYFYLLRYRKYQILKSLYETNSALIQSYSEIKNTSIEKKTEKSKQLYDDLIALIKKRKLYLEPDLDLGKLAHLLNSNERYISEAINKIGGKNLNQLINDFRLDSILKEIHELKFDAINLNELSTKNGFNSRTTFYRAFKEKLGMSPKQYLMFHNEKEQRNSI
jgi:AraC-like DNA-binding protein/tetrahydromethanopterin S-methyltransferase subunit F